MMKNMSKLLALVLGMLMLFSASAFAEEDAGVVAEAPAAVEHVEEKPAPDKKEESKPAAKAEEKPAEKVEEKPAPVAEEVTPVEEVSEPVVEEAPVEEAPVQDVPAEEVSEDVAPEAEAAEEAVPENEVDEEEALPAEGELLIIEDEEIPLGVTEAVVERSIEVQMACGDKLQMGDTVILNAILHGYEGVEYSIHWQMDNGSGWSDISGANELQYTYTINEETNGASFRAAVTLD